MPLPALDFPNPPLTVGQTWAGTNGTTYTWDGAVWTATAASGGGGGGPPTGPAGGDLTGTYPNPTIGPLAVGNAEISDLAYSKLTGAPTIPTTLPPTGPAGGALSGTYPNPGVVYSAITGTPTSLPPSGTAGGALTGTYPNPGVSYAAITGTPTSLPPSGAASGDLTGTYPGPTVAKVNGQALTAGDIYYVNATPAITRLAANATASNQYLRSVSSGVPSWQQVAYADVSGTPTALPPSGTAGGDLQGTYPNPTIKPTSLPWTVSGTTLTPTAAANIVTVGTRTTKERLLPHANFDIGFMSQNATLSGSTWAQDDTGKPSWMVSLDATNDVATVQRIPAGSTTAANQLVVQSTGNTAVGGQLSTGGVTTAYTSPGIRVTGTTAGLRCQGTGTAGADGYSNAIAFGWNGALTCRVDATNAGTVNITPPSDGRLKADVREEDLPGLDAVRALRPVTFAYRQDTRAIGYPRGRHYGLIAQEAQPHVPAAVEDDGSDEHWLSIDYRHLVPVLIKAVKELAAQIQELKERER